MKELQDCFSWGELKGTVVNFGDVSGHISIFLAGASTLKYRSSLHLFLPTRACIPYLILRPSCSRILILSYKTHRPTCSPKAVLSWHTTFGNASLLCSIAFSSRGGVGREVPQLRREESPAAASGGKSRSGVPTASVQAQLVR